MPEPTEQSQWAPPQTETSLTSQQLLDARYPDRENPDDMDDMVMLPSDRMNEPKAPEIVSYVLNKGESYVYVPRKTIHPDGSETTRVEQWKSTGKFNEQTGKRLAESLVPENMNGKIDIVVRDLEEGALAPEVQDDLEKQYVEVIREKGHQVLDVAGVVDPSENDPTAIRVSREEMKVLRAQLNANSHENVESGVNPFDELPKDVQAEVLSYRTAQRSKIDAENDKRFADAADAGRHIYSVGKRMSQAAQVFVGFRP
jgi:uncharacterized protein YnzC (UPF0291/DUF896 family)